MVRATTTPHLQKRHPKHWQPLLLIAWVGLLAYAPLLQSYVWAIDDYPLSQMANVGGVEYLENAFQQRGVWRLLQHGLVGSVLNGGPWLPGLLAVFSHILTCQCFYLVIRNLYGRLNDAFLLAVIAACSPLGFQAIAWTSAWPYVLSSLVLWMSLWMFQRIHSIPSWAWLIWALLFGASLLVHDHLLFALSSVTGASWLLTPEPDHWRAWAKPSIRWLPPVMAVVYLAAYVVWKPTDHLLYMEPHFHWSSLLGPLAHLWHWADIWAPFSQPDLWQVAASEWPLGWIGLTACLVAAITTMWLLPSASGEFSEVTRKHAARVIMAMMILFLMASLIYVPAGGYSLDSRKRYPLFLFLLGGGGMMMSTSWRRFVPLSQPWLKKTAMTLLVALLMVTCWLHVGLWRAEARATRLLSDFLAAHPSYHQVQTSKMVDPAVISPATLQLHGQPWILSFYVAQPFVMDHPGQVEPEIKDAPDADVTSLIYDYRSRKWEVSFAHGAQ